VTKGPRGGTPGGDLGRGRPGCSATAFRRGNRAPRAGTWSTPERSAFDLLRWTRPPPAPGPRAVEAARTIRAG